MANSNKNTLCYTFFMKLYMYLFLSFLFLFAGSVSAQNSAWLNSVVGGGMSLVGDLTMLLTSVAFGIFLYGLVRFITQTGDEKAVDSGKQLMIWGVVALFVIIATWGLVEILQNIFVWGGATETMTVPQTG